MQFDPNTSPVNELQIRCKLINGTVDSVMADKTIGVKIYQSRAPQDQHVISALTGYPPDFVTVIDSIAI